MKLRKPHTHNDILFIYLLFSCLYWVDATNQFYNPSSVKKRFIVVIHYITNVGMQISFSLRRQSLVFYLLFCLLLYFGAVFLTLRTTFSFLRILLTGVLSILNWNPNFLSVTPMSSIGQELVSSSSASF